MLDRLARILYLAKRSPSSPGGRSCASPGLHENAQWSDVAFALTAAAWAAGLVASRRVPRFRAVHAGLALYLGWAVVSLLAASPRAASGPAKLLGVAMLVAPVRRHLRHDGPPGPAAGLVGRTLAATSLLTAAAAVVGVALSYVREDHAPRRHLRRPAAAGRSPAPRPASRTPTSSRAGACSPRAPWPARTPGLSRSWRRLAQAALAITVVLTTSRAILAFALAAAIRGATTPFRRRCRRGARRGLPGGASPP